jgi:hypothetical protein
MAVSLEGQGRSCNISPAIGVSKLVPVLFYRKLEGRREADLSVKPRLLLETKNLPSSVERKN